MNIRDENFWDKHNEALREGRIRRLEEERCQRESDRRRDREVTRIAIALVLVLAFAIVGFELVRAKLTYGEWRCAWAECRIVIER